MLNRLSRQSRNPTYWFCLDVIPGLADDAAVSPLIDQGYPREQVFVRG